MTTFKKQIFSVIATGAVLLSSVSPVFADTTIQIVGNGVNTDNTANVSTTHNVTVQQSNQASITNNVTQNADSGKNSANENTGGDVSIDTGEAKADSTVSNTVNSNVANVNCACENSGKTDVLIKKNGDSSDNTVNLHQNSEDGTNIVQQNAAEVTNNVEQKADSGKNNANENTGGTVSIDTGAASAKSNVSTTANANVANVGGSAGEGAGSLSAVIFDNGVSSDNDINLSSSNDVKIWQANEAEVANNVDATAKSGHNNANENTGGDVSIETGKAKAWVGVDNSVNFNSANVGCECVTSDVTAAIDKNGDSSDNNINASLGGDISVFQGGENLGNDAVLANNVDANGKSGKNNANENTGPAFGADPVEVMTGEASSSTNVSNSGNENLYGTPFELPGGNGVNFSFNFQALFNFFGVSM